MENLSFESVDDWWQAQPILIAAQNHCWTHGSHLSNPYHSPQHCEAVAKAAIFYGTEAGLDQKDLITLGLAGLFHDFNHSGELLDVFPDHKNIGRALQGLLDYSNAHGLQAEMSRTACRIIANTEVQKINGDILFQEPTGDLEAFLRDADVTQLLFSKGLETQPGLAQEMGLSFTSAFRRKSVEFLYAVHLYTEPAQQRRTAMRGFLETWMALT